MSAACELHLFALMNQDPVDGFEFRRRAQWKILCSSVHGFSSKADTKKRWQGKARRPPKGQSCLIWLGLSSDPATEVEHVVEAGIPLTATVNWINLFTEKIDGGGLWRYRPWKPPNSFRMGQYIFVTLWFCCPLSREGDAGAAAVR